MITADCFPTPDLALRSTDPVETERVQRFAPQHAIAAQQAYEHLADTLSAAESNQDRHQAFARAYTDLVSWRYHLACHTSTHLGGHDLGHDAARFITPITNDAPNCDRLGRIGRLRHQPQWDPATRSYRGGTATPASRMMDRAGAWAHRRCAEAGVEVLLNEVTLPDGNTVPGNLLLRGAAGRAVGLELMARVAARGLDVDRFEVGDLYVQTGTETARQRLHQAAMRLLAGIDAPDATPQWRWATAVYLIYQSPLTKKGSDAVHRTFAVTVGAHLLGFPPRLPQDLDLRAYIHPQHEFVPELLSRLATAPALTEQARS